MHPRLILLLLLNVKQITGYMSGAVTGARGITVMQYRSAR